MNNVKLSASHFKSLERAADLTARAAGIIESVTNDLIESNDDPVDDEKVLIENLQEAYDMSYSASLTLYNVQLEPAPLDGGAPNASCT